MLWLIMSSNMFPIVDMDINELHYVKNNIFVGLGNTWTYVLRVDSSNRVVSVWVYKNLGYLIGEDGSNLVFTHGKLNIESGRITPFSGRKDMDFILVSNHVDDRIIKRVKGISCGNCSILMVKKNAVAIFNRDNRREFVLVLEGDSIREIPDYLKPEIGRPISDMLDIDGGIVRRIAIYLRDTTDTNAVKLVIDTTLGKDNGFLAIASNGSILKLPKIKRVIYPFKDSIYISTDFGVYSFRQDKDRYAFEMKYPIENVRAMYVDSTNKLHVISGKGLFIVENGKIIGKLETEGGDYENFMISDSFLLFKHIDSVHIFCLNTKKYFLHKMPSPQCRITGLVKNEIFVQCPRNSYLYNFRSATKKYTIDDSRVVWMSEYGNSLFPIVVKEWFLICDRDSSLFSVEPISRDFFATLKYKITRVLGWRDMLILSSAGRKCILKDNGKDYESFEFRYMFPTMYYLLFLSERGVYIKRR